MSAFQYLEVVRDITRHIENTQTENIGAAADLIVDALTHKGVVYCAEIGHGNQYDFLNRAGGLAAVQHFQYTMSVNAQIAPQPRGSSARGADRSRSRKRAMRFAPATYGAEMV